MKDVLPGTTVERDSLWGEEFLNGIFAPTGGIYMSQIREMTGLETPAVQNWVKRGWLERPVGRKYDKDRFARILIINMLRGVMQLDDISFLLTYINGRADSRDDDIIPESVLYGYICSIYDMCDGCGEYDLSRLDEHIDEVIRGYRESIPGGKKRLKTALRIILTAYKAAKTKDVSDGMLSELKSEKGVK